MSWSRRFRVRSHLQASLWPIPCLFGLFGMLLGMAVWRFDRWLGWAFFGFEHDGATALIRQPIDGSEPRELMNFDEDELFDFGYSADGQSFAVTRGEWQHDIMLISDLMSAGKKRL